MMLFYSLLILNFYKIVTKQIETIVYIYLQISYWESKTSPDIKIKSFHTLVVSAKTILDRMAQPKKVVLVDFFWFCKIQSSCFWYLHGTIFFDEGIPSNIWKSVGKNNTSKSHCTNFASFNFKLHFHLSLLRVFFCFRPIGWIGMEISVCTDSIKHLCC